VTVISLELAHDKTPEAILGRMAIPADLVTKALTEIVSQPVVNEAVVLSTCNRTEIYVDAERFHDAYREVRDALGLITAVAVDDFVDFLTVRYSDEAIEHLFAVTAGLESAVLGEHEILGQVRGAWETARVEGTSGTVLDPLFHHALIGGKRVRTETAIGRSTASLSHAAVNLLTERIGSLEGRRLLLVGAGEVGAGVVTAIRRHAMVDFHVANRTPDRAAELAAALDGSVVPFADLGEAVASADVVITATASSEPVITARMVGDRPVLIFDLAMPADVHADVAELANVELVALSDLQTFANRGLQRRQAEIAPARAVIQEEIDRYRRSISAREVDPLLGSMHRWADGIRAEEIARYRNRLGALDESQEEAIEALTRAVVAKMLHQPSSELRGAAGSPRGERLAEAVRELFDLS
jgi:glutamyl-tRNA reductase